MKLRRGWMASVVDREDDFEILCDGDFVWLRSDNPLTPLQDERERLLIGKVIEEDKAYIGDIEPYENCIQIGYDVGSARIHKNFYELADKKIGVALGTTHLETPRSNEIKSNLSQFIQKRKANFLGQEKLEDLKLMFLTSTNSLRVNKLILAQVSPIFYEMESTESEVLINDFDFNCFKAFIE